MRLCSNVPAQYAIQTAPGGYQSIDDLVAPGGRLHRQRDLAFDLLTSIPGVTCRKPQAATHSAATVEQAIKGAADKLKRVLESTLGRLGDAR